jgi:hypothetical protein
VQYCLPAGLEIAYLSLVRLGNTAEYITIRKE